MDEDGLGDFEFYIYPVVIPEGRVKVDVVSPAARDKNYYFNMKKSPFVLCEDGANPLDCPCETGSECASGLCNGYCQASNCTPDPCLSVCNVSSCSEVCAEHICNEDPDNRQDACIASCADEDEICKGACEFWKYIYQEDSYAVILEWDESDSAPQRVTVSYNDEVEKLDVTEKNLLLLITMNLE